MVGVAVGFQVDEERAMPEHAQRRGGEHGAFEAVGRALTQHDARRPGRRRDVIGDLVEKALDANGVLQRQQRAALGARQFFRRWRFGLLARSGR